MKKHLTDQEYEVLRLSYGLDCEKHSAKEIAAFKIKALTEQVIMYVFQS